MGIYALTAPLSSTALAAATFDATALQTYGRAIAMGELAETLLQETSLSDVILGNEGSRRRQVLAMAPDLSPLVRRFQPLRDRLASSQFHIQGSLARYPQLTTHPQWVQLLSIVAGTTSESESGHPQLSKESFETFRDEVPHLFGNGQGLLDWLDKLDGIVRDQVSLPGHVIDSVKLASKAVRTMVKSAAVTAPPDLWLLRQILATHQELGTLTHLNAQGAIEFSISEADISSPYAERHGLDAKQLYHDMEFLFARGYLERIPGGFIKTSRRAGDVLESLPPLNQDWRRDMTGELVKWFLGVSSESREMLLQNWLTSRYAVPGPQSGWSAGDHEIELGYRLVPMVLALKATGKLNNFKAGTEFAPDHFTTEMAQFFEEAGLMKGKRITELGERIFFKGPGPFGIIGTYHSYLNQHHALLRAEGERPDVARAENIVASKHANRRTFKLAVKEFARYRESTGFEPTVVIEHALGHGVAIQEYVEKFGADGVTFVGADFETKALDAARHEQANGVLPENMIFSESTDPGRPENGSIDIADPDSLIRLLKDNGLDPTDHRIVMFVGAGFHEARRNDREMIEVFRRYSEAGIMLFSVETPALTPELQRASAWQSYNAGFTWVHETSGQRLRAHKRYKRRHHRMSWSELLEEAGYVVSEKYSHGTRPLFPFPTPEQNNPPISWTTVAIPE